MTEAAVIDITGYESAASQPPLRVASPMSLAEPVVRIRPQPDPEERSILPSEWVEIETIPVGEETIDRVLVGPNGVFAIFEDPDARPAAVRTEAGILRAGTRVGEPVKRALRATHALRGVLAGVAGGPLLPYPVLITGVRGESGARLGRLLVIRPGRLAEAIWRHPSRPLTRSQRARVVESLEALSR